ncbi:MAG TPA: SpaA isopeptide-forming pilin-related protein [Clostridiaceae bacterium]|nr:SpaA isopeptide-forming pilin-related protein [Clostridiaceae bacterium]
MKNIKTNKLSKKVIAIILLIITMMTNISHVFAVSGSDTFIASQWATYYSTTESKSDWGILLRRLTNSSTGVSRTVFCSEYGKDIRTGVKETGNYYTPTSQNVKKACKVAYFGWYSKYGDYLVNGGTSSEKKKDYAFTQQFIWEVLGQSYAKFNNSTYQSQYEDFKNEINMKINTMSTRPSFDAENIVLEAGETKVLTDTNKVLADYGGIDNWKDGIRFQHNKGENTLTITVSDNCTVEKLNISDNTMKSWGLIKEGTEDCDSTIYFEFEDDVQNQLYALNYNDPVSLAFSLRINLLGNLELSKLNTNGDLVDGSIFTVNGPGYNGDVEVKNGKIVLEKIKKGTYTIKEKSTGGGYLLNKNVYKVEIKPNQAATQAIVNDEPTGEITIVKTDKDTGNSNRIDGVSHHGDANLNGTEYTLYAKEDIYNVSKTVKYFSKDEEIAKFTFDKYGNATIIITNKTTKANLSVDGNILKGLPMGMYYSKETHVVEGYTSDEIEHIYTFSYKDMNTPIIKLNEKVENTVKKAKFEVIKISSNTNTTADVVENAEFTAILTKYVDYYGSFEEALKHLDQYAEDEYSIFKTQANGHGVSGLLAYGEYTCYETNTPSDKINTVQPFYIKIDRNSDGVIKEFVENDTPFESYLKLVKVDKNTGKKVTLSNATFKLDRLNEKTNEWERVTCKLGKETFDSWKTDENGVAYTETKVKAGTYRISEVVIPNGFLKLEQEIVFEVNKSNKALEFDKDYDAYITVTVANEQPTGTLKIDKSVAIREDVDASLVDISDLSGIKFKLSAKEDIINYADGSIIYEKGKEVGQYSLTKEGMLLIEKLPMGSYELEEISTLDGLVLDTTKHEIVFKQEDTTTKVYTKEEKLVNDTTSVEFSKTDITGDKELKGATLTVTDSEGNVIDKWISGEKTHKIEGLKVGKTYVLKEEIQVDSYVKATDIKFEVKNTNEVQKVTMIDKLVEVIKTDVVSGEEIEGAELIVTDENGNEIDRWISSKEPHHVKGLEEGKKYFLEEKTCPYGYEIAEKQEFVVSLDKETQRIEMKDMPILKSVQVEKIDKDTGEHIKSNKFKFGIYEDEECTKLIKEAGANEFEGTALFENLRYGTYYIKELRSTYRL